MTAVGQNIALRQGDTRNFYFPIKAPGGGALSFIAPEVSFVVTADYEDGPDYLIKTGISPTLANGLWSVTVGLSKADTGSIPIGKWMHQLRLSDTDGTELTLALGFFEILPVRPTP